MSFVHLHSHTQFSIKDAMNKIPDYVKRVKELGMNSAAITDHGVMYGVIEFYKKCKDEGIKPILGCEVYVAPGSRFEKDNHNRYNHLILLAENNTGFQNLSKICTEGFKDGFYYRPRIDDEILEKYHEGIICTSACVAGRIPQDLIHGDYEKAKEDALKYMTIFGKDNFFLEIQNHGLPEERIVMDGSVRLSKELGIPLVATNDCHYTYADDADAHDVLLCMQQEKKFSDPDRMKDNERNYYVRSEEEMRELFRAVPEAIDNTQKIADRCNVEIEFHNTKMPEYPLPEGYTAFSYLKELCNKGFEKRYGSFSKEDKEDIKKQLEYQLDVIKNMGYVEYFLIVWDYINWCRENDIPVGPGRGSAAGSYVTYCIGITDIDPRAYQLQFERFLNPERVSMPDIDVDFDIRRRSDVIEHCKDIYGKDNVVQIITFGTMAAKEVIKDTGKVLEYAYDYCNNLTKMIPNEPGMTITKVLNMNPEFKALYENDRNVKELIDMSLKLEGLPKSTGTHAAGVIISKLPTEEYIPLAKNTDGTGFVSQFNMIEVEELGLLKMDFLGLRTLTVIDDAFKNIKAKKGINITEKDINYEDEEVYRFISSGRTNGIFQLESKGMQGFMTRLKPTCIEDLIAGISLYRPGPMDYIPQYIEGKNNKDNIQYDCPELIPILKPTYGCIVYQEQVTQICRDLAGYSMGAADNIRRAMSKKKQYVIDAERKTFVYGDAEKNIPGAIKNVGISEEVANGIYDHMVDFAKYAFNKSHAACYAIISYQTAWIMYYYPTEYWAAIMTSVIGNNDKLTSYIQAAKNLKIKVLAPDINKSENHFIADDGKILYALSGIKGISETVAELIVNERNTNGLFTNFADTLSRLQDIGCDKSCIYGLICSGAFDSFNGLRSQYEAVYEDYMANLKKEKKNNVAGQLSLFDVMDIPEETSQISFPQISEFSKRKLLEKEKEVAGVYISGHPLDSYNIYIQKYSTVNAADFVKQEDGTYIVSDGQECKIVALISEFKKFYTKKGDAMAFISLEDLYGEINAVIFPKVLSKVQNLSEDDIKLFNCHVSIDDEKGASLIIDNIENLDNIKRKVWIKFDNKEHYDNCKYLFNDIHCVNKTDDMIIYIADKKIKKEIPNSFSITDETINILNKYFGQDNVKITI